MWYIIILFYLAILFYGLRRVDGIYKYRMGLLDQISRASKRDIDLSRKWKWRYDYLDSVSFGKMLKMFWKPLDSFYKDKSFIEF